jgi:hypothetical protein
MHSGQENQVPGCGLGCRRHGNPLVEGHQRAAFAGGQRKQIDIGDLMMSVHFGEVGMRAIANGNVIGPEFVVERLRGGAELCSDPLESCRAMPGSL